jgi:DnaJ-class molecular chaperone
MCKSKPYYVSKTNVRSFKSRQPHRGNELIDCPRCGGAGALGMGRICAYCKGEGVIPK